MPAFVKLGDIKTDSATDGDDVLIGLDVGPVNKRAEKGWWTVDGANFRDTQQDSLTEGGHSMDTWTTGVASTTCTGHCLMDSSGSGGSTYMTETFEPAAGMNSFGESLNPAQRSNWSELCDVGTSLSRAELLPRFAIV